jgi:hypothetical protein
MAQCEPTANGCSYSSTGGWGCDGELATNVGCNRVIR